MSKNIRSIHFIDDKVIVDYGEYRTFQFCKDCKNGNHLKNFLNFFCPEVDLQLIDEMTAIHFERRFYHILWRGPARRIVNREAHLFGEYVVKRCESLVRLSERAARKAARLEAPNA